MIKVENLCGGYGDGFHLKNISFSVSKGEFFGIIGPNGSGKTTLVKMMSGILKSTRGSVLFLEREIDSYRPKELAKKLAVLPQLTEQSFRFTVRETIALGRYAHQTSLFTTLTKQDDLIIDEVMAYTDVTKYANVTIDQLSGGERQRVFLAQALAQQPEVIILDEPTNHLDLAYQKDLLDLLHTWTVERGLTVIAIFHDLNLAALYCDRLLLLSEGEVHVCDVPNEVIQHEHISTVYKTNVTNHSHPVIPKLQVMLTPKQISSSNKKVVSEKYLIVSDEKIMYHSPIPLKTVSTSSLGVGNGWFSVFVNSNVREQGQNRCKMIGETERFLKDSGLGVNDYVLMLTRTNSQGRSVKEIVTEHFTLLVVVTVDSVRALGRSQDKKHVKDKQDEVGAINTWIFIEGKLLDYVFTQVIVTATEAKAKALQKLNVLKPVTIREAENNSTDNILVATTQKGHLIKSATTTSSLGAHIGEAIDECVIEALQTYE